jgi:hypothetical protein
MTLSRRTAAGLLCSLFVLAFVLRAYHPISRPPQWHDRSLLFQNAMLHRRWSDTYQSRHPGVTTMTVGAVTLWVYRAVVGTPAEKLFSWAAPPFATPYGQEMAAGVLGLALTIAVLLVAVALALRRLGGWPLALTATGLLVFAPFYMAESRVFHVDGLLSTFMLLSALLLLIGAQTGHKVYLLLSGFLGGCAVLSKTPGIFLIPYTGLTLLVHLVVRVWPQWADHGDGRIGWLVGETWRGLVLPGLLWLVMMIVPLVMWPAMWEHPGEVLDKLFSGASEHVTNPHIRTRFFAGQILFEEHPSAVFYPTTMLFNSTFVTLTLALAALGLYTLWRKRVTLPLPPVVFWLLVAYAGFFTIQMTIGAKQVDRYVLPALVMLDLVAAVGLVGVAGLLREAMAGTRPRLGRALAPGLIGLAVGLQALVGIIHAPDYGAHHNYLLGGNLTAQRVVEVMGQNEGILYVADHLRSELGGVVSEIRVTPPIDTSLEQYFTGKIEADLTGRSEYYLFGYTAIQRNNKPEEWRSTWDAFHAQGKRPELVVVFDGVEFMWLYPEHEAARRVVIRQGWVGLTGVAWLWTAGLVGGLAWAVRRTRPEAA